MLPRAYSTFGRQVLQIQDFWYLCPHHTTCIILMCGLHYYTHEKWRKLVQEALWTVSGCSDEETAHSLCFFNLLSQSPHSSSTWPFIPSLNQPTNQPTNPWLVFPQWFSIQQDSYWVIMRLVHRMTDVIMILIISDVELKIKTAAIHCITNKKYMKCFHSYE